MSYSVDTVELKKAMAEKEINNIEEFSQKSGVGRDTLSGVVKGKIRPSTAVMDKIATTLELEPERAGRIFFVHSLRIA